ncbi:MAG: hypothetical protein D6796_15715, partial [Caldilineae bacterium]
KVVLDTNLYVLEKESFDRLLQERPAIAIHMTRELGQRLVSTSKQRFKSQARRISALWGMDRGELVETINRFVKKSIAILPLPGCAPYEHLTNILDVFVLPGDDLSVVNLASQLGMLVEVYGHILILLPREVNALARKALSLADTVISIGPPPLWVEDNVPAEKIWEAHDDPVSLNRVARRLTGHTVGLALSSGGGKGLAHIGVMKVLRDEGIPVDMIAGTSAGAFFGIFFALGWDDSRFDSFADEIQTLNRWVNWDINIPPRAGVLKGAKARDIIARLVENKTFDDINIPFYCVAADVLTGEEVVFESGELAEAIRASLSIPILADPWQIDNRYLIDGAFVDPIPARLLREKGADIVIASSVIRPLRPSRRNKSRRMPNFLKIITNIQNMVENQLIHFQQDAIDVLIHSDVHVDHVLDFKYARDLIAAGEAAARAQLPAIRACLEVGHDD